MIIELLVLAAMADTPKQVPDNIKAKFFQAQAKMISANAQVMEAQRSAHDNQLAFQAAKEAADKSCGEGFSVQTDASDDLTCVASPAMPPKPVGRPPEPKKNP